MGLRSRITSEAIILIGGIGVTGECAVGGEKMNPVVGIDVAKDDHWGNYSCCESSYLFYYKSICQTLNQGIAIMKSLGFANGMIRFP